MVAGRELDRRPLVDEKRCSRCGLTKAASQFGYDARANTKLKAQCRVCQNQYNKSESALASKRAYRARYAKDHPEKVRARLLVGKAVKRGYIPRPSTDRAWYNNWEFHHPDYARPYYGVWVTRPHHRLIDDGRIKSPRCTDWEPIVIKGLVRDWGLAALAAVGTPTEGGET